MAGPIVPAEVIGLLRPASRLALESDGSCWNHFDRVDCRYCFYHYCLL